MAEGGEGDEFREQDRYLPIANVARIMKHGLPPNAKIAKDAKETVQECASEFVSFITSEASDKCSAEKRKTINGDDILWAMGTLGFDKYVDPLRLYLQKYRESVKGGSDRRRRGEVMSMPQAPVAYRAPYGDSAQEGPLGGPAGEAGPADPSISAAFAAAAAAAAASTPAPSAAPPETSTGAARQ